MPPLQYDVFEKLYDYFSQALQAEPETVFLKRDGLVVKPSDTPWMIKLGRDETLGMVQRLVWASHTRS